MKKILLIAFASFSCFSFSQSWNTSGNSGTTPPNNFIGNTDDKILYSKRIIRKE